MRQLARLAEASIGERFRVADLLAAGPATECLIRRATESEHFHESPSAEVLGTRVFASDAGAQTRPRLIESSHLGRPHVTGIPQSAC
jgi:hypothetical protein